ncbi:hypothetical protein SCYAM73S_04352 [Streptomyces cyaneofuscatus]
MPTARPIIMASVEVVEPRSRAVASAVISETPMPTPIRAVSSGSPAAISEPKVMTRTTPAMATPMISAAPVCGMTWSASPPISTFMPLFCASLPASFSESVVVSVSSMELTLYATEMYAVEPSWLTAWASNGSATEAIWSEPDCSSLTMPVISLLLAESVTFSPSGALKTTRAVAPSALEPGKRCSSRSKARCASVPGMEKELEVAVDAEAAPNPASASSATQIRAT